MPTDYEGFCPYVTVYESESDEPEPSPVLGVDGLPVCWYHTPKRRIGFNLNWSEEDET